MVTYTSLLSSGAYLKSFTAPSDTASGAPDPFASAQQSDTTSGLKTKSTDPADWPSLLTEEVRRELELAHRGPIYYSFMFLSSILQYSAISAIFLN